MLCPLVRTLSSSFSSFLSLYPLVSLFSFIFFCFSITYALSIFLTMAFPLSLYHSNITHIPHILTMLTLLSLCLCLTLDSTMLFSLLLCFLSSCYARFPLLFHRICSALPALIASQTANNPCLYFFSSCTPFCIPTCILYISFISHLFCIVLTSLSTFSATILGSNFS
ncbi:hypothetical protein F5878DRAFT_431841 [Lentinula raphanica]|uniref:Uncharacterized protein n=1 Tax=Lentinula raphanica TaxID=153919 RepID=A0AA38NYG2_9AGAR|nr:hypothetical protein F5878DRAFT_431841 [Lentinula raphanica]